MKKSIATLLMVLVSSQAFAQKMQCSLEERTSTGDAVSFTKAVVIEAGKVTTLKVDSGATLEVTLAKVCAMDGGPCQDGSRLNIFLTAGDAKVSTSSGETVVSLILDKAGNSIRALCLPAIGQ